MTITCYNGRHTTRNTQKGNNMKIIATHTANNANKTTTTMWKSNGGHSWYIGVLGTSTNKIWHVGSERYIRGIWNREYSIFGGQCSADRA